MTLRIKTYEERGYQSYIDAFCSVLLALCPVLQHYRGPVYNMAFTSLIVIALYYMFRVGVKIKMSGTVKWQNRYAWMLIAMIIYQVFRVVNHGSSVTEIGQAGVFAIFMLAMIYDCMDFRKVIETGVIVSLVGSVGLILQYIYFYLIGFHLQLVPIGFLINSADQWVLGAQTGLAGVTEVLRDFYRPSAFFLEPSHAYLYMFPFMILLLFAKEERKKNRILAFVISIGLLLSTSAMGVAAVAGAWAAYLLLYDEKDNSVAFKNIFKRRNLIAVSVFVIGFILAYLFVPLVRKTISRVFSSGTKNNAIEGRISGATKLLSTMGIIQWIIGVADNTAGITTNMPGLADVLYRHGILGMILSYTVYVAGTLLLPFRYAFVSAAVLMTSLFSAHTHSLVGMLFYTSIIMYGFSVTKQDEKDHNLLNFMKNDVWHFIKEHVEF